MAWELIWMLLLTIARSRHHDTFLQSFPLHFRSPTMSITLSVEQVFSITLLTLVPCPELPVISSPSTVSDILPAMIKRVPVVSRSSWISTISRMFYFSRHCNEMNWQVKGIDDQNDWRQKYNEVDSLHISLKKRKRMENGQVPYWWNEGNVNLIRIWTESNSENLVFRGRI